MTSSPLPLHQPYRTRGASPLASAGASTNLLPHWVVRWAFYLFVASIPFEFPDRTIPLEVTTITGCVLLLATLRDWRRCFARVPPVLWCFSAFLYLFWISFVVGGGAYADEVVKVFAALLQLMLVFWVAYNLMHHDTLATRALLTLSVACFLLASLTVAGVTHLDPDWVSEPGRVTLFGQDANRAGLTLGSGALALVGLTYARDRGLIRPRILIWPVVAVIGMAMLKGGSRGSLLAFILGLWTFTVSGRTLGTKLRNTVVALIAVGLLVWAAWESPLMRSRFERAEGLDWAQRQEIFPTAAQMFLERPLTGWGPVQNKYEIGARLPLRSHIRRDPHNLVLEVLTSTGLLGGVPFFLGMALCVWGAWRARRGTFGILPFAMVTALLVGN